MTLRLKVTNTDLHDPKWVQVTNTDLCDLRLKVTNTDLHDPQWATVTNTDLHDPKWVKFTNTDICDLSIKGYQYWPTLYMTPSVKVTNTDLYMT
jgi:hypothetical protein